ncbi:MAG: hypothetical protein JOZ80_19570 [Acidobacteriaceae bacterium]|nr:hypothetical protein [Acidobacteriaceae bacterium]
MTKPTVEQIPYRGWNNVYKLSNGTVELIVTADIGPRILHYGFCGSENLLHEVEADAGKTRSSQFRLYGGHRLWVSPEIERTYYPDNFPVVVSQHRSATRFTSPPENLPPGTHLQKEFEIELLQESHVQITHRVTNHDNRVTTLAPWSPTMMGASGRVILPLPPRAPMENHVLPVGVFAVWSYTDFADPRWSFGTKYLQLQQSANPTCRFKEQMGGIYNPDAWGAYFRNGFLFVKRANLINGTQYPDFGCNFEVFTNSEFIELETLGPLTELQPGATVAHMEHWWLLSGVPAGNDESWIDAELLPRINETR